MLKFIYFLRISVYMSGHAGATAWLMGAAGQLAGVGFLCKLWDTGEDTQVSMLECEHPDLLSLPTTWLCFTFFFFINFKKKYV